jgi:hypothetical protein
MKSKLKTKVKITPVKFRKFENGDIIAFFPDSSDGKQVVSYEHNGQHSGSDVKLMDILAKATPVEYADLKKELDKIYEHLTVIG